MSVAPVSRWFNTASTSRRVMALLALKMHPPSDWLKVGAIRSTRQRTT